MTILVSAGHGNIPGRDRGAVGNGIVEGEETLRLRDSVAEGLRGLGFRPKTDGPTGFNDPLSRAIELAHEADIAVEFHFNAGRPEASGVEVLAHEGRRTLAQELAQAISGATGLSHRGTGGWKSPSSGQHARLGFCEAGGLVVEVCFLSNPSDVARYRRAFPAIVQALARALAHPPVAEWIGAVARAAPRNVRRAFTATGATTVLLPAGTRLFRFHPERTLGGPEVSPWWIPVQPLRPGDAGLADLEGQARNLGLDLASVARAGLAVTRQWNSMEWLIVATLSTPARALLGKASAQRVDQRRPSNVVWIGGRPQLWIPGLRLAHLRCG